jgi:hypothetical protein
VDYNFSKADTTGLRSFLNNIDWEIILNAKAEDMNTIVDKFYAVFYEAIELFVPKTTKCSSNRPPWFDSRLINLRNRKNKAHKRVKSTGNDNSLHLNSYIQLRREFDWLQRQAYREYISRLENNLFANPKESFVNVKRKCTEYPASMYLNEVSADNSKDICELFADFFQSTYKKHNDINLNNSLDHQSSNSIGIPYISENDVFVGISRMNLGCGADNIPTRLLKDLDTSLAYPLSLMFNASLRSGIFPEIWKHSIIIPIFKSGKRCDIKNYRGISILSSLPKLFELIVCDYLYFNVKSLFSSKQHGFIRKRSTTTNLLSLSNQVLNAFESRMQFDVVFTDFAKAFDSPPFEIILHKLDKPRQHGISPIFLTWIGSYLKDRKQFVTIDGEKSKLIEVHSGVPQGSHLGPVLFNLFINEIADLLSSECLLYADDLKIIKTVSSSQHCEELQNDLDLLFVWSISNKLYLNLEKCKIMSFHRKKDIIRESYHIGDHELERVTTFKDLGVVLDHQLDFREHVNYIVAKSNSLLGFVRRMTRDFRNPYSIRNLYCSLVRSNLEYSSIIWNPAYKIHIDRIERVQNDLRTTSY